MTENIVFWNAPLPSYDGTAPPTEEPQPITIIGVTRSGGVYSAVVAQDLDAATGSGLLRLQPLPAWLNAANWHQVRITVQPDRAQIEVAQANHPLELVLEQSLLHLPEPLGFEFSVDNEGTPGAYLPVVVPDGLDLAAFEIGLTGSQK